MVLALSDGLAHLHSCALAPRKILIPEKDEIRNMFVSPFILMLSYSLSSVCFWSGS